MQVWFQNRRSKEKIKRDKAAAAAANAQSSADSGVVTTSAQSPAVIQSPVSVDSSCSNSNFPPSNINNLSASSGSSYSVDVTANSPAGNLSGPVATNVPSPVVPGDPTSTPTRLPEPSIGVPVDYLSSMPQNSPMALNNHAPLSDMDTSVSVSVPSNGNLMSTTDDNRLYPMDVQSMNGSCHVSSSVSHAPLAQNMMRNPQTLSQVPAEVNATTPQFREPNSGPPSVGIPRPTSVPPSTTPMASSSDAANYLPLHNHTNAAAAPVAYPQPQQPSSVLTVSSNFALTPDFSHPPPPTASPVVQTSNTITSTVQPVYEIVQPNKQPVIITTKQQQPEQPSHMYQQMPPQQSQPDSNATMQYYGGSHQITVPTNSSEMVIDSPNVNNNAVNQNEFSNFGSKNWNITSQQAVHAVATQQATSLQFNSSTPPVNENNVDLNQRNCHTNAPPFSNPPQQTSQTLPPQFSPMCTTNGAPPTITPGSAN